MGSPKKAHGNEEGSIVNLEFKHMSDVTDQYIERARQKAETQYASLSLGRPSVRLCNYRGGRFYK